MSRTYCFFLALAFVAAFFAVGVPYWQIPYSKVSLPNSLPLSGLLTVGITSALFRLFGKLLLPPLLIGLAVPSCVLWRVIQECVQDPTSHNLWPFEVVIALFLGIFVSSSGLLAGSLLKAFSPKKS